MPDRKPIEVINLREHKKNKGLFLKFRDVCQLEGVTMSVAIRFMMKNAVDKFEEKQNPTP